VTTTAHRHEEIVFAGEVHRVDDVGDADATGEESWTLIDQAVPD
jgi:hypothetical protein